MNKLLNENDITCLRNLSRDIVGTPEVNGQEAVFLNDLANRLEKLLKNINGI